MVAHYAQMATALRERWHPRRVIEVGCNDGTLLQHFRDLPHLGIEPSDNVAQLARDKGLHVWTRWWTPETACLIAATWGRTDQDIQHLAPQRGPDRGPRSGHPPDLGAVLKSEILLVPGRAGAGKDPSPMPSSVGDFDSDEHACLSVPAVATLAQTTAWNCWTQPQPTHGGVCASATAHRAALVRGASAGA
jgi:hypothetical protein